MKKYNLATYSRLHKSNPKLQLHALIYQYRKLLQINCIGLMINPTCVQFQATCRGCPFITFLKETKTLIIQLLIISLKLAVGTPSTVECTSSHCHCTHKRRWSSTKARSPSKGWRCTSCTGLPEKGSIHHQVSFGSPVPAFPFTLWCILMLGHLPKSFHMVVWKWWYIWIKSC